VATSDCALYRPRLPEATPLYRLVQTHYTQVRDTWEERYEGHYGFWRSATDKAIGALLDCGILENDFARVRCSECRAEFLVAFSCKGRGMCPSCAAKRAAGPPPPFPTVPRLAIVRRPRRARTRVPARARALDTGGPGV
jgi:hypothetical protein